MEKFKEGDKITFIPGDREKILDAVLNVSINKDTFIFLEDIINKKGYVTCSGYYSSGFGGKGSLTIKETLPFNWPTELFTKYYDKYLPGNKIVFAIKNYGSIFSDVYIDCIIYDALCNTEKKEGFLTIQSGDSNSELIQIVEDPDKLWWPKKAFTVIKEKPDIDLRQLVMKYCNSQCIAKNCSEGCILKKVYD